MPRSHTPPQPYAIVHFGGSGYVRFIREGGRLLLQIEEPDGGAEVRLTEEQRLLFIRALLDGQAG